MDSKNKLFIKNKEVYKTLKSLNLVNQLRKYPEIRNLQDNSHPVLAHALEQVGRSDLLAKLYQGTSSSSKINPVLKDPTESESESISEGTSDLSVSNPVQDTVDELTEPIDDL